MATSSSEGELNLVPYLDIMMNLVIFMIVSTSLVVPLRETPVLVPGKVSDGVGEDLLTVSISRAGISVLGPAGVARTDLPRDPGTARLDYDGLTAALRRVKGASVDPEDLRIVADRSTPYSEIVGAVDAARDDDTGVLYPGIELSTL